MDYEFYTLDVFTQERFAGNGLAVVLGADDLSTEQMQRVSREFNLSESVFVLVPNDPANTAKVRIFTPGYEMPFAGHPTIGAAVLLASRAGQEAGEIRLEENLGLVPVVMDGVGDDAGYGQFTSPVIPKPPVDRLDSDQVARALGLDSSQIGFDDHQPGLIDAGNMWVFVPVNSMEAIASIKIDAAVRASLPGKAGTASAYVYCRGGVGANASFHSRMFASAASGIGEDPATGSATAALPGQIIASQDLADGVHEWHLEQGFEMGRPSELSLEADVEKGALSAVRVGGHAVIVSHGTITI